MKLLVTANVHYLGNGTDAYRLLQALFSIYRCVVFDVPSLCVVCACGLCMRSVHVVCACGLCVWSQ